MLWEFEIVGCVRENGKIFGKEKNYVWDEHT